MKSRALNLVGPALAFAALLALVSCKSDSPTPKSESTSSTQIKEGVPGGVVVETYEMTATVTGIDDDTRTVTLATADGKKSVKCGPEVRNYDQIRVGDQLKLKVAEELAVYMATEPVSERADSAALVALAPKGSKPGGVVARTMQVNATVVAIDVGHHRATLKFPDGSLHTVAVRHDVDLSKRKVGEQVVIRITEAVALEVEKPQRQ